MKGGRFRISCAGWLAVLMLVAAASAWATPEYAERSGRGCATCHVQGVGGPLTETGLRFAASGYVWPPEGGFRVLGPIRKTTRFFVGFLHITAAFLWFGTILYVHILLRPAYASKGLPRGEMQLGMLSMLVVGVTGVLLTVSRVSGFRVLTSSPWGIVLSLKILVYLVMISSAVFVVVYLGPRLKAAKTAAAVPADAVFDPVTLAAFDGKEGTRALIAHEDIVYDVSDLRLWKGGLHMKHGAGGDMTAALSKAPHGPEKLEAASRVGTFDPSRPAPLTPHQKLFYVIAYVNLALVFVVMGLIAYWRWGI